MVSIDETKLEINTLIRAKNPLIVLTSSEETRSLKMLKELSDDPKIKRSLHVWSCTSDINEVIDIDHDLPVYKKRENPVDLNEISPLKVLQEIETDQLQRVSSTDQIIGKIYVLLDFNEYLKNPVVLRKIRDLSSYLPQTKKCIIFLSPVFTVPEELNKSSVVIDIPYPTREEIKKIICDSVKGISDQISFERDKKGKNGDLTYIDYLVKIEKRITDQVKNDLERLIDACLGLTEEEIKNIVSKCLILSDLSVKIILSEKKQIIKKSGTLEYIENDETLNSIGGLIHAKKYVERVSKQFSQKARDYGIDQPKGILLIGAPGTGKSLFAKAISNVMKLPLLRMDLSAQGSKWLGQTEQNMIKDLKVAHTVEPAILFVDEIEKNISSGDQSHEANKRSFGTLLTDMEEKTGLFYIATCNNPQNLPPELLSRFQKIFYVDLPSEKDRKEIFAIHLKKVKRDPKNFDLNRLVAESSGYSGREIRNIVQESLSVSFNEDKEVTTDHVIREIKNVTPVSVLKKDELERLKQWIKTHNVQSASEVQITEQSTTTAQRSPEL